MEFAAGSNRDPADAGVDGSVETIIVSQKISAVDDRVEQTSRTTSGVILGIVMSGITTEMSGISLETKPGTSGVTSGAGMSGVSPGITPGTTSEEECKTSEDPENNNIYI